MGVKPGRSPRTSSPPPSFRSDTILEYKFDMKMKINGRNAET